jgi:hypothetical protein
VSYLPRLKQWLDEAKVKLEYYREGSDARVQLETHIKCLEDTIDKIEHLKPREAKSADSGQGSDGSEKVSGSA